MERSSRKSTTIAERQSRCVFCRDPIPLVEAMKNSGICKLCAIEVAELAWRTVYDRDANQGEIPANLKAAYGV